MIWQIQFKKSAFAEFSKLPIKIQQRIDDALQILVLNPYNRALNVKKLKGYEGLFRLRVADYRVLYELRNQTLVVLIIRVGHRRDIYD